MTSIGEPELRRILDRLARATSALAEANEEISRCRASERSVHAVLESLLTTTPTPVAVVDAELRIRAVSASAEALGVGRVGADVRRGVLGPSAGRLRDLARSDRDHEDLGRGWQARRVQELGLEDRCALVWLETTDQG